MSSFKPRIGYACMNLDISPNSYKTCRKNNISDEKLTELIQHNLLVLKKSLQYNIKENNKMFRISSSLIPFGSSELNTLDWEHIFAKEFKILRSMIDFHEIRISMHPGQYTVLNSPNQNVVNNAIDDLNYHLKIINLLAPVEQSKIILHVGGVYGDKDAAMKRFIEVYKTQLSSEIKKHLVIENDDRLYTVEDVLNISSETNIPVVFDNLHHDLNPSLQNKNLNDVLESVIKTWKGVPAKFHYSQQLYNKRPGAHSNTIDLDLFIKDYHHIYAHFEVDIILEVKDKNRSFIKVNQFFNPSQKVLEQEWARYKYWVMSKSQKAYNDLRFMFKNNPIIDPTDFYRVIDSIYNANLNIGAEINAISHVWGYFKKHCTDKEKLQYMTLLETKDIDSMKKFLLRLAHKYETSYLLESYYF